MLIVTFDSLMKKVKMCQQWNTVAHLGNIIDIYTSSGNM